MLRRLSKGLLFSDILMLSMKPSKKEVLISRFKCNSASGKHTCAWFTRDVDTQRYTAMPMRWLNDATHWMLRQTLVERGTICERTERGSKNTASKGRSWRIWLNGNRGEWLSGGGVTYTALWLTLRQWESPVAGLICAAVRNNPVISRIYTEPRGMGHFNWYPREMSPIIIAVISNDTRD